MNDTGQTDAIRESLDQCRADFEALRREVGKVIVGLSGMLEETLTALIAGGHVAHRPLAERARRGLRRLGPRRRYG
jgi:hypothetical protein